MNSWGPCSCVVCHIGRHSYADIHVCIPPTWPAWYMLVSHSQTLSSIVQHRRGKGLEAFPGDNVSFPLGLGEYINVNQRFDLLRECLGRVCAGAIALALERDLRMTSEVGRGHWYDRL